MKKSFILLLALAVALFATDVNSAELNKIVTDSYTKFDHPEIAPIQNLSDKLFVLELFHGPTLAGFELPGITFGLLPPPRVTCVLV